MTARERVCAAFSHREPDRTPVFEYVLLPPIAETVLGHRYVDYGGSWADWYKYADEIGSYDRALGLYAADRAELAARLEHDMLYVPTSPPEKSADNVPSDDGPWDPEDPVDMVRRGIRLMKRELENPVPQGRDRVFHYVRDELSKRGLDLPIYASAVRHGIWTNTDLMQTMVIDPDTAHEHFRLCTVSAIQWADVLINAGVEIIGVGGDFAGNRPLISPSMYRQFIMPELKKVTDHIRAAGAYSVNASDGNLWDVLDEFLLGAGVDGYGEIDAGAGMDMAKLKKAFGDSITFLGNIDCGNLLSFAAPEDIRKVTIRCLEDGAGNGGHIFTASNAITESVPLKNYLAMAGAYREYFGLPDLKIPGI
jgi:hypothetical protein